MTASHGRVRVRRLSDYVYEVEEPEAGRLRIRVDGDIILTDYGSYYAPDLFLETQTSSTSVGSESSGTWLVAVEDGVLRASVSLKVLEVYVREGSRVRRGEKLVCVETMKMIEYVVSPCNGVVEKLYVKPGMGVTRGGAIARIRCEG